MSEYITETGITVNVGAIITELQDCRDTLVKCMKTAPDEEYENLRSMANAFQQSLEIVLSHIGK